MPIAIPEESTAEEYETFQKWKDDNLRVRFYILSSMSPELKRQYMHSPNSYSIMTQLRELFMNQEQVLVHKVAVELLLGYMP